METAMETMRLPSKPMSLHIMKQASPCRRPRVMTVQASSQLKPAAVPIKLPTSTVQDHGFSSSMLHRRTFACAIAAELLATWAAFTSGSPAVAVPWDTQPNFSKLLEPGAKITNPNVSWTVSGKDRQLFYPDWLLGTWQVDARFVTVSFPLGQRFVSQTLPGVLKCSMVVVLPDVGAAIDRPIKFQERYIKSSDGRVIADRAFNVESRVDAFLGYSAVHRVTYDAFLDPTRMAVVWATPRKDTSQISEDLRKAELFINNRQSAYAAGSDDFFSLELYRQLTQAVQQGFVFDYEVINHFTHINDNTVAIRQRVAAFLQPQDRLYFDAGSNAVALYDYEYSMQRM